MGKLNDLTEDYSRTPVPPHMKVGGLRVAAIIVGIVITVPILVVGAEVSIGLGLAGAIQAFFHGGLILAALGCLTAVVGAKANLSTYVILQFPFGQLGGKIVNLVLASTVLGWYAVTADIFGEAVNGVIFSATGADISVAACTLAGSMLMILTTVFGFKALDRLALVAVPLLVLLLGSMAVYAFNLKGWDDLIASPAGTMTSSTAMSVIIGGYIVGIVLMPDLTRYAKTAGHGAMASVLSMLVALPLVLLASAIACVATGEKNLVALMIGLGIGLPAMVMLTFATWTSNAVNLYSSSLVLAAIVPRIDKWKLVILAGIAGTIAAVFSFATYFIPFLITIGVMLPPVAGIYIADFFAIRRQRYDLDRLGSTTRIDVSAMTAWIAGSVTGLLTAKGVITMTGISGCDSLIVASVVYLAGKKALSKLNQSAATSA